MESEESACLLIVSFGFSLLRKNWGGWRKQGKRQLMWLGRREWTSAFDLMSGPNKELWCWCKICLPPILCLLLDSKRQQQKNNNPKSNIGLYQSELDGARAVKSLICTSQNSHKSPVPLHPHSPPPTQFPVQQSSQYEARLVYCDSIWLSTQGVRRHSFFIQWVPALFSQSGYRIQKAKNLSNIATLRKTSSHIWQEKVYFSFVMLIW